jgi:hypothetical protein
LKLKRNHKTIITALLLALYAFMATPVSYWHHHKGNCAEQGAAQHPQAVKKHTTGTSADCKICSHHYSPLANDAVVPEFAAFVHTTRYKQCCLPKRITRPGYTRYNRGPPALV